MVPDDGSQSNDAATKGGGDRGGAIIDVELIEDMQDVHLDRRFRASRLFFRNRLVRRV